mgnify:CR=1 FL=1
MTKLAAMEQEAKSHVSGDKLPKFTLEELDGFVSDADNVHKTLVDFIATINRHAKSS